MCSKLTTRTPERRLANVEDFQKHACYKIEMSDKTSLHILCL